MLREKKTPTLGRYHIIKELHCDAYGVQYSAIDPEEELPILLKVIAPDISNNDNFIIRFELLKSLLPAIEHPNLLNVVNIDSDHNVYYVACRLPPTAPSELQTLATFDIRNMPNRHYALEQLFHGIAMGLHALEKVRDSYHKNGIIHNSLSSEKIFITLEKPLVGHASKPVAKIDGFWESFLYFGDEPEGLLKFRIAQAIFQWKHPRGLPINLFDHEHLYPAALRRTACPDATWHIYSFGALAYCYLTGHYPRGIFSSVMDSDPTIDPLWDEIINGCLATPLGRGFSSMQDVVDKFKELSAKHSELPHIVRRIKEQRIPEGMALIILDGKVELGSNDGAPSESPRFRATLKPFFIDVTPVTCKQFECFLSDYQRSSYSRGDDHPATLVSWHMAKAYCRWRSEREGLPPDTYRLPSEYEWEACVRGITGQQYPWGTNFDATRVHCQQRKEVGTKSVKAYPPGRFGLYDILGNAWEWTESRFQGHPFSKHVEKGYSANLYVVKGGCWLTPQKECRASLRAAFSPNEMRGNIGFRCARSVKV